MAQINADQLINGAIPDGINFLNVGPCDYNIIRGSISLTSIYFDGVNFNSEFLNLERFPNLKKIGFNECSFERNMSIISFATDISLDFPLFNNQAVISYPLTTKDISFSGYEYKENDVIEFANLPALNSVSFEGCVFVPGNSIRNNIKSLWFSECSFTDNTLIELPNTVEELTIGSDSYLNSINRFPSNLVELTIFNCDGLTVLPDFPESLEILKCSGCSLVVLPQLPAGLRVLECPDNQLNALPALPVGIEYLDCTGNPFQFRPALPQGLSDYHWDFEDEDNVEMFNG